jgi:hypothetical protein
MEHGFAAELARDGYVEAQRKRLEILDAGNIFGSDDGTAGTVVEVAESHWRHGLPCVREAQKSPAGAGRCFDQVGLLQHHGEIFHARKGGPQRFDRLSGDDREIGRATRCVGRFH